MILTELINENTQRVVEIMAWAKRGEKVVRKFRCSSGPRKGRIVSDIGQCAAAPDVAKRHRLKITKARLGKKMARKARRTKRVNQASIKTRKLNK